MSHHVFSIESLTQTPHNFIAPKNDDLSTFFELESPFSWEAVRKNLSSLSSLQMIKEVLYALNFEDNTQKVKSVAFIKNYSEQVNPYYEVTLAFLYPWLVSDCEHALHHEKEHSEYLENILEEMTKWMDCFGFWQDREQLTRHTQLMVWNDAATAVRLQVFTYVLQRLLRRNDSRTALCERILRTTMDHYLLLASDAFYNSRTNHGFFQNASLLSFCLSFPQFNGASLALTLAEKRLLAMLEDRLSDEGFLKEHSTTYQIFFLVCHMRLLKFTPLSAPAQSRVQQYIQKMLSALHPFIMPDGSLAYLGDSYRCTVDPTVQEYLQTHPKPQTPPVTIYPSAGYGFLHSAATQSHVILAGAFHSRVYKHCDELHVLWSEGAENILVDSGMVNYSGRILPDDPLFAKGFWYSDPKRIYVESVHAHNCVEINGESYSRKVKPFGALPMSGGQASGTCLYLKSEWTRPEGFTQARTLVLHPGQWLLVLDKLLPSGKMKTPKVRFSQWFHLGLQAQPALLEPAALEPELPAHSYAFTLPTGTLWCQPLIPPASSSTHYGELEPRLQGWVATQNNALTPGCVIGFHNEETTAQFATLFTLNKKNTECNIVITKSGMQVIELGFSDGSTDAFSIQ